MTHFLIRHLIRDAEHTNKADVRTAYGMLAGTTGIVCNLLLFVSKLIIGLLAHSISITADAFNNLSDIASGVVALVGFRVSAKPPDEEHPFGHARFEYIAGLTIAGLILVVGVQFLESSVEKILHPAPIGFSAALCIVLVLSIGIKLWLSHFYGTIGDAIGSASLKAAAKDSINDVLTTTVVLVSAVVERVSGLTIDGIAGLFVSVLIIYSCVQIARDTISPLLGENADPELVRSLADKIKTADDRVLGLHDLMVHDYGPGQRFASVHLEIDAREDVLKTHELIDAIERRIREEDHIQLLIHHDPVVTDDPEQNHLHRMIEKLLAQTDEHLRIHDFRIERREGDTCIRFDMVVPPALTGKEEEIQKHLQQTLNREEETYTLDITFDTQSFNRFEEEESGRAEY